MRNLEWNKFKKKAYDMYDMTMHSFFNNFRPKIIVQIYIHKRIVVVQKILLALSKVDMFKFVPVSVCLLKFLTLFYFKKYSSLLSFKVI